MTTDLDRQSGGDSPLLVIFKGMLMGAVEIVPGVSAGTLALITGILPRLLSALKNINWSSLKMVFRGDVASAWRAIDGNFLCLLAIGLASGFLLLLQFITYALENHPVYIWSFFFGLILASAFWLAIQIQRWARLDVLVLFASGLGFAVFITLASPQHFPITPYHVFFSGMIAISAMMLPGLSGSFMLMLAGMYEPILNALKSVQVDIIVSFMCGASIGILVFSHILSFLFQRFPVQVYAFLTGVMLGSLNRVWPWQEVLRYRVDSHGEQVPMLTRSISPLQYEQLYQEDSKLVVALLLMSLGVMMVWLMSHLEGLLSTDENLKLKENQ